MKNNEQLVYDFSEHGLYYENPLKHEAEKTISLVIDTLELEIDYSTGNILSATGFLPLIKAVKKHISIPQIAASGDFSVSTQDIKYQPGIAYDYFKFSPESEPYFINNELPVLEYDAENRRILIGTRNDGNDQFVKTTRNLICGLDGKNNLKSLLILVDIVQ